MLVSMITVTGSDRDVVRSLPPQDLLNECAMRSEQLRLLRAYRTGSRLSFAGRLPAGRAGVILGSNGHVSGHKLDPINDEVEYEHFPHERIAEAIRRLVDGHPVLIEGRSGRVALRWSPLTLEVYGEGRDTHTP